MGRLVEAKRIPLQLYLKLLGLYVNKLLGREGDVLTNADNYYYLTLIAVKGFNRKIGTSEYTFTAHHQTFFARKYPSSDLEVFNQVWGRREYREAIELLTRDPEFHGDAITIIDAGANVGYATMYFKSVFPNAQVYSIEPDAGNFLQLTKHIRGNNFQDVEAINAGIWNKRCYLEIDTSFRDQREWSFQVKESVGQTELQGISIAQFISEKSIEAIDLLKVDVEGAERFLFENEQDAAFLLSRTKVIAIEIHDEVVSRAHIQSMLSKNGFTYFECNDFTIAYRKTSQNAVAGQ